MKAVRRTREHRRGHQWYYLQQHRKTGRVFVDRKKCRQSAQLAAKPAKSWLDAKRSFGFELTPLQEMMLAEQNVNLERKAAPTYRASNSEEREEALA